MVIVSAGIRPRDELARECGLTVGERGGVVVDDRLQTSDPSIFAIGEVALHAGMIYGLVAPGYEMAEIVAANLTGDDRQFAGADLSTKLKLMGVDVASFGDYEAKPDVDRAAGLRRPVPRRLQEAALQPRRHAAARRHPGRRCVRLRHAAGPVSKRRAAPLSARRLDGFRAAKRPRAALRVCPTTRKSARATTSAKAQICEAISERGLTTLGEVKACTKAGTGCGGCIPLVTDLLHKRAGGRRQKQSCNHLCEHFAYTRQELFADRQDQANQDVRRAAWRATATAHGCEICKPAVASILASLWNENILDPAHQTLQDTNDRFLANMQRGGLYSVVPRVPGGEITPDQLIALGRVAKKYGLYTKITGGQRVDLFGAQVHQLPDIWEELIDAGIESGHAYGKALRTVKSCVGTTWCRYGVQDSVGFAIRIEKRYRGMRSPHKIKAAVSGCIRECAEAQGKDFGLIATEKGYNLYVCGNGGAKPRHADLLGRRSR